MAPNVGLSSEPGSVRLWGGDVDDVCATFRAGDAVSGIDVRTVRLDEAIGESAVVDFLKIDVEGWEAQVIEGAGRIWRERRVGIALIEANPQWGSIEYLLDAQEMGYRCFEIHTKGRVRRTLDLRPLDIPSLRQQRNVLLVRPDRMDRLG